MEPESAQGRRSLAESRMGSCCQHQVLSRSGGGGRQAEEETLVMRHTPGSKFFCKREKSGRDLPTGGARPRDSRMQPGVLLA